MKKKKKLKDYKLTKREKADIKVLKSIQINLNAGLSYQKIADCFNLAGTPTRQGAEWSAVQVFRVVKRNKLKKQKVSLDQSNVTPWTKEHIIKLVIRNRAKRATKKK